MNKIKMPYLSKRKPVFKKMVLCEAIFLTEYIALFHESTGLDTVPTCVTWTQLEPIFQGLF